MNSSNRSGNLACMGRINWLTLFAIALALHAVWANRAAAFETGWLVAAAIGLIVIVAWIRDRSIGRWLAAAAATMAVAGLVGGQSVPADLRIIAAGVCAGALAGLGGWWVAALLRRDK
jgi:hypothetical protein